MVFAIAGQSQAVTRLTRVIEPNRRDFLERPAPAAGVVAAGNALNTVRPLLQGGRRRHGAAWLVGRSFGIVTRALVGKLTARGHLLDKPVPGEPANETPPLLCLNSNPDP
jgi:hypothetical protein